MDASLSVPMENGDVLCQLCRHRCRVKPGERGVCGVRENVSGHLKSLVYDKVIATHIDPIEKKPIFHLSPGSGSYSIATVGCNFRCRFCQNSDIAQMPKDRQGLIMGEAIAPETIVERALQAGCKTIAYTYTEPTVYFELARDTALIARQKRLKNIFVTNGYMTPEAIDAALPFLDAANVDLKAFSDAFYQHYCGARRSGVMDTLKRLKEKKIWLEITTLVIPGLNDSKEEIQALAQFIATELGPETPWHVSRFHPAYRLTDRPPTPVRTLAEIRKIGIDAGLFYVYTGNVPGDPGENTYCHGCKKVVIERRGYRIMGYHIQSGCCAHCGAQVSGVAM